MSSATELVIAFVMGFLGTIQWAMHGLVDIRLTLIILAGSLFGVQLGAIGTTYVKEHMIKIVMGSIMLIVAVSRGLAVPRYLTELKLISVGESTLSDPGYRQLPHHVCRSRLRRLDHPGRHVEGQAGRDRSQNGRDRRHLTGGGGIIWGRGQRARKALPPPPNPYAKKVGATRRVALLNGRRLERQAPNCPGRVATGRSQVQLGNEGKQGKGRRGGPALRPAPSRAWGRSGFPSGAWARGRRSRSFPSATWERRAESRNWEGEPGRRNPEPRT